MAPRIREKRKTRREKIEERKKDENKQKRELDDAIRRSHIGAGDTEQQQPFIPRIQSMRDFFVMALYGSDSLKLPHNPPPWTGTSPSGAATAIEDIKQNSAPLTQLPSAQRLESGELGRQRRRRDIGDQFRRDFQIFDPDFHFRVMDVPDKWYSTFSDLYKIAENAAGYLANALGPVFSSSALPEQATDPVSDLSVQTGIEGSLMLDKKLPSVADMTKVTPDKLAYLAAAVLKRLAILHKKINDANKANNEGKSIKISDSYDTLVSKGIIKDTDLPLEIRFSHVLRGTPGLPATNEQIVIGFGKAARVRKGWDIALKRAFSQAIPPLKPVDLGIQAVGLVDRIRNSDLAWLRKNYPAEADVVDKALKYLHYTESTTFIEKLQEGLKSNATSKAENYNPVPSTDVANSLLSVVQFAWGNIKDAVAGDIYASWNKYGAFTKYELGLLKSAVYHCYQLEKSLLNKPKPHESYGRPEPEGKVKASIRNNCGHDLKIASYKKESHRGQDQLTLIEELSIKRGENFPKVVFGDLFSIIQKDTGETIADFSYDSIDMVINIPKKLPAGIVVSNGFGKDSTLVRFTKPGRHTFPVPAPNKKQNLIHIAINSPVTQWPWPGLSRAEAIKNGWITGQGVYET
ncbi:hypothetical protein [Streptomyces luteireticuli]|uniref:hypothetical protein n=1 Tax=Streptomyces luteireticuli TaxID=173858 RepID=UPI0035562DD5